MIGLNRKPAARAPLGMLPMRVSAIGTGRQAAIAVAVLELAVNRPAAATDSSRRVRAAAAARIIAAVLAFDGGRAMRGMIIGWQ